jgi:OOP family OmpA-OmpF porin
MAAVEAVVLVAALVTVLACCGRGVPDNPGKLVAVVLAHHAGELAPALAEPDLERLRALALDPDSDGAVAFVAAAGRSDVDVVDLEPRRPNGDVERGPRTAELVEGRLAELRQVIRRAAEQSTSTDLLRALDLAARSGARLIIVLSAGLSVTDPLDLRTIGWDQDPTSTAQGLAARRLLPDLTGRLVVFSGLSRVAGPQPVLGLAEQARLRDIWLAVCAAAHATCAVDDIVRPAEPAVSGLVVPTVDVPAVSSTAGPGGQESITVPAALLFGPDSCEIPDRSAARALLEPVAARLRSGAWVVSVSGRTAPAGGTGVPLAECRAHAAADMLRTDLGVPSAAIADVRGDGSLLDPPVAALDEEGRLDPTRLAALRRVVFTLVPAKEF